MLRWVVAKASLRARAKGAPARLRTACARRAKLRSELHGCRREVRTSEREARGTWQELRKARRALLTKALRLERKLNEDVHVFVRLCQRDHKIREFFLSSKPLARPAWWPRAPEVPPPV